jgi:hypothetical protein
MVYEEIAATHSDWSSLQQPAHPAAGMNPAFRALLAAIDLGWEVAAPVAVTHAAQTASIYHFTLAHKTLARPVQIAVPATPQVERFIHDNGYAGQAGIRTR